MRLDYNHDEWLVWEQPSSPMLLTLAFNAGFSPLRAVVGASWPLTVVEYEGGQARWLNRWDDLKSLGQRMIDMLVVPGAQAAFADQLESREAALLENILHAQACASLSSSLQELVDAFNSLTRNYYRWYAYGWFCEPVEFRVADVLNDYVSRSKLADKLALDPDQIGRALFFLEKESFATGITRDLLEVAESLVAFVDERQNMQESGSPLPEADDTGSFLRYLNDCEGQCAEMLRERLESHADSFHWKTNNYSGATRLSPDDVLQELLSLKTGDDWQSIPRTLKSDLDQSERSFEDMLDVKSQVAYHLPPYYRSLAAIASQIGGDLKDRRKAVVMQANAAFDDLLASVANLTECSVDDLHLLVPQEVEYFAANPGAYTDRFTARRSFFLLYQSDLDLVAPDLTSDSGDFYEAAAMSDPFIAEGNDARSYLEVLNERLAFASNDEARPVKKISGAVAYSNPGQHEMVGTVRVMRNPREDRLSTGEILVAPSTTPDFMDAIRRCSAIITDWGGQTSHAAICAKEFGKPCIVGTNYASQLLASGDKVRLDFIKGTVEISEPQRGSS